MLNQKLFLRILANSALGVVLIFVWSRFVNLSDLFQILKTLDPKFGLVFFGLFVFSGVLRGLRFKLLIHTCKIPLKDAVMLTYLSQFLSFMIPVRAGEISKSVYLTSQFNVPLPKTITWVFVDRILDLMVILFLIALLLPLTPTNLPSNFVFIILIALLFFVLFFLLAIKSEAVFKKIVIFLSNFLIINSIKKWFVSFMTTIVSGLSILQRKPHELAILVLITTITLISDGFVWLSAFWALGVDLSFTKSILGNSLVAFSFLVPAAPGFVGSAEAAGLAVFSGVLRMEPNMASAGTVLFHVMTVITLLILGVSSLYFLKFDLNMVWKKIRGK